MGQLSNPERIAIDSSGNIYVTDTGDIQKFNSKGISMSQFLANATYQCCLNVMGIVIDSSNNIYVADMESHRIIKFSSTGSTLSEFNSTFSVPQISGTPQDVAIDPAGNIYVADTYNGRIVKLDSTGHSMSALEISGVPVGIAIKDDKVYVTDLANDHVDIFLTSQFVNNGTSISSNSTQRTEIPLNQNSTALDAAIKLASSSPQFQSLVNGYNYTFTSDFEESGPLSTGGIGLTDHGFAFELYSGPVTPGSAVKVVEVLEDPTLTKILNVISYPAVYHGPAMPSASPTNSTVPLAQNNTLLSPLKQFKSGVAAKDVTCEVDFHLVINAEDGSPACVRPETAQKLVERGWGSLVGVISTVEITSVNDCGQFYTAPENHGNSTKIPVLMMNLTSTGCARLSYTIDYDYNSNPNGPAWSRIANFTSSLPIDDLNFHGDANQYSISSGKDYTNSFQITVVPQTVDLTNFPIGSNFTVTYIIKPLTNATGFYDESILKPLCFRYPLAVGYGADQVNSSDFSMGLAYMQNHSCVLGAPYQITLVEVSGMSYKEMALP